MKRFHKILIAAILFFQLLPAFGQNADHQSPDSSWNSLSRKRGYQLLSGFDTISRTPLRVYALYMKGNKFGLLDGEGKELVKALYDEFPDLDKESAGRSGLYALPWLRVYDNNLYGIIDYQGREILPVAYSGIRCETRMVTEKPQHYRVEFRWYQIDSVSISFKMDRSGRIFDRVKIPEKEKTSERDGLGRSGISEDSDNLKLRIGEEDSYPVTQRYTIPPYSTEQEAMEKIFDDGTFYDARTRKYGFVNKKSGNTLIPVEYDRIVNDRFGRIVAIKYNTIIDSARRNNIVSVTRKTMYDLKGKLLFPLDYEEILLFNNLYFLTKNGKIAIYDTLLKPISDHIYDEKIGAGNNKVMSLALNGKYALFNLDAKPFTDFEYDRFAIPDENDLPFPMIIARKNGKEAIMDYKGNFYTGFDYDRIIAECHVSERGGISVSVSHSGEPNAYFFVKKNNLWGIMDTTYNLVVECAYSDMNKCYDKDIIYVKKDRNWGILRIADQFFIYPVELIRKPDSRNGFFVVFKESKYGIVRKDGTLLHELTLPADPHISRYYPGLLRIRYSTSSDLYSIYVDHSGNKVTLSQWRNR